MKIPYRRTLLALALLGVAGCRSAHAEQTPDPPRASPSAAPSAAPSVAPLEPEPKAEGGRKPWVPSFSGSYPEGSSDPPAKEEWAQAAEATEARITAPDCKARRIREWYRIDCSYAHWIDTIAGKREGVSFGCSRSDPEHTVCDNVWVVFPMRRGDRRAFELFIWSKYGPEPDSIATAHFLDGDAYPSISVQGIRWAF